MGGKHALSLGRLSEGSPGWRQFPGGPPQKAHTVGDCSSEKASLDRTGPWSADPWVRLPFLKTVLWAPVCGVPVRYSEPHFTSWV